MEAFNNILFKLNGFIRKYYINRLIKGSLLFLAFGLLFFLAISSLELLLWLNQSWRLVLFVLFVFVELFLLYRFIIVPTLYLFKIKRGLSYKEAAKFIGLHFPKIDDKLYNLLELKEDAQESELLLASIEQKSKDLDNFSFVKAIDLKDGLRYAKYVLVPLLIIGLIWISGNIASFFNSYQRVVNYDLAYEQPAPFRFHVLNEKLTVLDNEPLTVQVEVIGNVQPENVFMVVNGEDLLLQKQGNRYVHTLVAPVEESSFYLTANGWDSKVYNIKSYHTPFLADFKMELDYPKYILRSSEVVSGTGNAIIPEGTKVKWLVEGFHIDEIRMNLQDSVITFQKKKNSFSNSIKLFNKLSYELSTSNKNVKDFETLGYNIDVIKDARPKVEIEQVLDSLNPNQSFYTGQSSDDYGLNEIRAVCYPSDNQEDVQRIILEQPKTNVHQFYYTFPSGFDLKAGKNYNLFFEVVDNDGIRGGKTTKSPIFKASIFNDNQLKNKSLEYQNSVLENLDNTLEKFKEQEETLSKINEKQKEQSILNFEDKAEIKDFLQKQQRQEQLMEKFSKDLKESLKKDDISQREKQLLKERLERQEREAKKNEKLLEELNKLSDKIEKEELKSKLEQVAKNQKNRTRSLEQILELTKRYYVTEKMNQMAQELNALSEEQKKLSEMKSDEELQKELNKKFDKLSNELDALRKDNEDLNKPLDLDVDSKQQESIKQDQKDALEEINKNQEDSESSSEGQQKQQSGNKASQKQKSAAQKMKEMSEALQQSAMGGGDSSDTEDAEMLRQILDNLITFSFKQENLMENVENLNTDVSQFSNTIKQQKELRGMFEHVDDSLFALSLRRVEMSELINEQIAEVYYNIDKSLESIAENQIYQGASYEQYVVNASNTLADFLADILDNMQQSMSSGQGSGQGSDFQLPDIIQGQQQIQEKMNGSGDSSSGKSGENGNKGEDSEGKKGEGKGDGENGIGEKNTGQGEGEQNGNGQNGEGNGNAGGQENFEMESSEIYEIFKQQQIIRQELENQLNDMINNADRNLAKKLIQQMEDFENDLLENGITQRNQNKVNNIQHQLIKLKNAALKQGKQKERESNTNRTNFTNPIISKPEQLKSHRSDIEILNRQTLPLRQNYDEKVKVYFKND